MTQLCSLQVATHTGMQQRWLWRLQRPMQGAPCPLAPGSEPDHANKGLWTHVPHWAAFVLKPRLSSSSQQHGPRPPVCRHHIFCSICLIPSAQASGRTARERSPNAYSQPGRKRSFERHSGSQPVSDSWREGRGLVAPQTAGWRRGACVQGTAGHPQVHTLHLLQHAAGGQLLRPLSASSCSRVVMLRCLCHAAGWSLSTGCGGQWLGLSEASPLTCGSGFCVAGQADSLTALHVG